MPYKSNNVVFSKPDDTMSEEVSYLLDVLTIALNLQREPVGIRFIFSEEEYEAIDVKEPKAKISYCKMIENATKKDNCKSKLEHHLCDGATTALGLENSSAAIESGETYYSYNLYKTPSSARRMRSSINSLHSDLTKTYGVEVRSVVDFKKEPDVLIMMVTPYQAMRLMQGYVYCDGIKPEIDYGAMQALCSELTVTPYLKGTLNVSMLCPSTRMLCKWSENEMGVSFPFDKLRLIVEGVMATMDATDLKGKRKEIKEKLDGMGIENNIDLNSGY